MFWKIKKMGDSLRDLWAAFATFVVKIKFLLLSDKKDTHLLKHLSIAGISASPSERGWGEVNKTETNGDGIFKATKNIPRTIVLNFNTNSTFTKNYSNKEFLKRILDRF